MTVLFESADNFISKELAYRDVYVTGKQLRKDINWYVLWYNSRRLRSTLGYASLAEFHQPRKVFRERVQINVNNSPTVDVSA